MGIPKYQKIKDALKSRICDGEFQAGDRFYTEAELSDAFSVSSITAIRALNELENEGFLVRIQGKGTFVENTQKDTRVHFMDIESVPINEPENEILSAVREDGSYFLEKLGLYQDDFYYRVDLILKSDNEPYSFETHYIRPDAVNEDIRHAVLDDPNQVVSLFKERIPLKEEICFEETDEVVFPLPERIAHYLHVSNAEPAILQQRMTYTNDQKQPIRYVESYKKWYYYKIKIANDQG